MLFHMICNPTMHVRGSWLTPSLSQKAICNKANELLSPTSFCGIIALPDSICQIEYKFSFEFSTFDYAYTSLYQTKTGKGALDLP